MVGSLFDWLLALCYSRTMLRIGVVVILFMLTGCRQAPVRTPEDAYLRLARNCGKQDVALFFDALDTFTQWSIETVHANQRRMLSLIMGAYPPAERERALSRIPAGADKFSERQSRLYFASLPQARETLKEVCQRLNSGVGSPVGSLDERSATATVWREGGSVFRFGRDHDSRWGFAELRDQWENAKLRALHDEETVRQNVALYRGLPNVGDGR